MTDFQDVYSAYFQDVYKYVYSLCRDAHLAEEVTQETFFKALKSMDSFRGQCKLYVWLCQIAKNTYFTLSAKIREAPFEDISPAGESPEDALLRADTAFAIHRILYKLELPSGVWSRSFDFEHLENGSSYLIPRRSIVELNEQQGWDSLLDGYLMIDVAEHNAWAANNGGVRQTKYFIGDPSSSNPLLVWEEGMVLPEAPEHLEAMYG